MFAGSLDVSVPTGSITENVSMKMMSMGSAQSMRAPYAMQLGSGTYDLTPSFTYLGAYYTTRYGGQVSYKFRTGENSEGYTLGNAAKAMAWVRHAFGPVALSMEGAYHRWGHIKGSSSDIQQTMTMGSMTMKTSPLANPNNYGGTLVDVTLGATTPVAMAEVGLNINIPLYQDLNGIQMKRTIGYGLQASMMF